MRYRNPLRRNESHETRSLGVFAYSYSASDVNPSPTDLATVFHLVQFGGPFKSTACIRSAAKTRTNRTTLTERFCPS